MTLELRKTLMISYREMMPRGKRFVVHIAVMRVDLQSEQPESSIRIKHLSFVGCKNQCFRPSLPARAARAERQACRTW